MATHGKQGLQARPVRVGQRSVTKNTQLGERG
jgi:hypothetical protein